MRDSKVHTRQETLDDLHGQIGIELENVPGEFDFDPNGLID